MYFTETEAERLFRTSGPFVHLHTTPKEDDVFFRDDAERGIALNMTAIALYSSDCTMLAFSVMDNHLHFILIGTTEQVAAFWEDLRSRLDQYFRRHGRVGLLSGIHATSTPINNLNQLRTEIAYVIRNRFVVNPNVNVFSEPWSSGHLYFNSLLVCAGESASLLKGRGVRAFTHSRQDSIVDARIYVDKGVAQPWSFVDYKLTERFFDDARQFVNCVLKHVEAQVETAKRLGEKPFLSDDELRPIVFKLCREALKAESPSSLDDFGKKQLAVLLKNKYSTSNKQIARLIKLSLQEVNILFPLAAPPTTVKP